MGGGVKEEERRDETSNASKWKGDGSDRIAATVTKVARAATADPLVIRSACSRGSPKSIKS